MYPRGDLALFVWFDTVRLRLYSQITSVINFQEKKKTDLYKNRRVE